MTYINSAATAPRSNGLMNSLRDLLVSLAERKKTHDAYTKTFNELSRMSDRDLLDIGLSRGDIPRIADESTRMS